MKQLDLGCGGCPRLWPGVDEENWYGIDVVPANRVKVADLVTGPIPFDSDQFDVVTAHDFMEHVPPLLYLEEHGRAVGERRIRRAPLVELFNEIYRVLKHGGIFHMVSPGFPTPQSVADPGHVSYWTTESANYYSGDYFGFRDHYGHKSRFSKVKSEVDGLGRVTIELRAVKDLPDDHPYLLSYD